MLNPSTANAFKPDPTVTRCMGFARAWGCDHVIVANLFALRSTQPAALYGHADPVGPFNDTAIHVAAGSAAAGFVVCAWGKHGAHMDRGNAVAWMLAQRGLALHCLATNKDGSPVHPLYQPGDRRPIAWTP